MPPANSPQPATTQAFDTARFARIVGKLGSDHEGERANAVALGGRMLAAAGMRWEDFAGALHQAEVATEAAAELLARNTALEAEVEQLRSTGGNLALMEDVGAKVTDTRRAAEWALDLHRRGRVWLAANFEVEFLTSCARWRGRLSTKQQPIFQRIMDRIVAQTGLTPP